MSCRLKHLAVAAAIIGLATHVQAGYFPGSTDFEDNPLTNTVIWSGIDVVAEAIVPDATVPSPRPATYPPSSFSATRENVLSVDNDVATPIVCNVNAGSAMPASTIYADVLVKGYPLASDAPYPEVGPSDKLLVYTRASGSVTNLCVYAKETSASTATNEFVLTSIDNGWHRIIIEALTNGSYKVYCDTFDQNAALGTYYPITAVAQNSATMSSVAFAGSGSVDDLIVSTLIPELPVTTLTWDTSLASVSYVDGNQTNALNVADGSYECQPAGAVTLIGDTGYRTVTTSGSAGSTVTLPAQTGIAKYFPQTATAGQNGTAANPYEIPDIDALNALKDMVAETNCANICFVQTANIDFDGAVFAGIGVYNGDKVGNIEAGDPRGGTPFSGTYDGQGYKISNIAFESKSYAGVFNQVNGGTIKNLTVQNATGAKGISIVGNAGNGATLQNLVAEGTFGSAANPAGHNAAGIAIRLSGGGTGTLVKDCTNNATIYGTYTKIGGICALTQYKVTGGGAVTFDGCANNGDLYLDRTVTKDADKITGFAGIVGYVQDDTVLVGCSNTGTLHNTNNTANKDKDGALIGWAYGNALTDNGGNSAAKTDKMVAYQIAGAAAGQSITGFKYATISGDVATTIAPPYTLAAGNTYLLEGNVAASETPVATLTAVGDTIAFDTALGYTFAGTVAGQAPAGYPVASTSGTVTTYTAGYFPRTATAGQDGSASNPFEIADVDDLQALAAFTAGHGLCYVQVADINMASADTFPGIGGDFTGTYDGGNKTISNIRYSASNYRGLFNKATGATIKNLTIDTVTFEQDATQEVAGAAFVGKSYGNATYSNLVAKGTIGTNANPCNHNTAGIIARIYSGSPTIVDCANEADIYCGFSKVGGICAIIQSATKATFIRCSNSGTITVPATYVNLDDNSTVDCGKDGVAGIIAYANTACDFKDCENSGTIACANVKTDGNKASIGNIIGKCGNVTNRDLGGNKGLAGTPMIGVQAGTITGFQYATVDNGVATTTSTLAKETSFLLERNVASGLVFTLEAAGDWIEFNKALGYSFEGTVANANTTNETGTVVRFAWVAAPLYPTYLTDADANIKDAYDTWKATNGDDITSAYEKQFLLNTAPSTVVPDTALAITAIEQNATAGWDITVECTVAGVDLSGTVGTPKAGNGYLAVSYTDDLGGTWTTKNLDVTASANGAVTINVNETGANFMKVKLTTALEPNE